MKNIFFDTESIGFFGATVMLQYCEDDGPAVIHNIWDHTVQETLNLIEYQLEHCMVGFNLVHDWYHYTRTYNVLSNLPRLRLPDPLEYLYEEKNSLDKYCLRPKRACDLMLIGRRTKFQATLNQKTIHMRKVPIQLADYLVELLKEKIPIPSIYFSKSKKGYEWRIIPLINGTGREATNSEDEVDPNFVNIQLKFAPSTSLKSIMAYIGHEVTTLDDLDELPKAEEYSWNPTFGGWIDVFREHLHAWRTDPRRIKYALNDPLYTRELWEFLDKPEGGDTDSELACAIGGIHWRGYRVDLQGCANRYEEQSKIYANCPINVNSPKQVKEWLKEAATPLEQQVLIDTSVDVLKKICDEWKEDNPELVKRCDLVLEARRASVEMDLLKKLLTAGRLHVVSKILGTKSNRMSGGNESYIKTKGGSVNPQGIKKGPGIRSLITLKAEDEDLSGGDFSGFEVSIAEAVYADPLLREELLSGKKMHALFGAEIYSMSYEDVLATEELNLNDTNGFYQRAKRGFFLLMYGGEADKLSQSMWITVEEASLGLLKFFKKYKILKEKRDALKRKFTALTQPGDIGTKIVWSEPAEYVESFLGFRRYFTLEFSIIRCLFDLAQNPPDEFKSMGRMKVVRRDRVQTASGAALSAIYAVAFGLQGQVFRAAANHEMQSPGGELTKRLQYAVYSVQPVGVNKWYVMPLNIHDEVQNPCAKEVVTEVKSVVDSTIESFKKYVPLIKMHWKTGLNNWGEK